MDSKLDAAELVLDPEADGAIVVRVVGAWRITNPLPTADCVRRQIATGEVRRVTFDTTRLSAWDSGLLVFLTAVIEAARQRGIPVDDSALPAGIRRLLVLATAVPKIEDTGRHGGEDSVLAQIGTATVELVRGIPEMLAFVGELILSFGRLLRGRAQVRAADFWLIVQEAGPRALPIITLISFIVGLILAFMAAIQLKQFGASIYVADMVALAMTREMGAVMTGIVMAGRTGAAFAAQLGSMNVNEEIDAYRTMGISPIDFLVLPRMLALMLMVPLLTLYADAVGLIAGLVIGATTLELGVTEYYYQTIRAVDLDDFIVGLSKAAIYGVLIAFAGCFRGMQSGRSAAAVGYAATSAVVTGIILMAIAAAMTTVVFSRLGI